VDVDPLVALEPDQPGACGPGQGLRRLGLPDPRLALEQERLAEVQREKDRDREPLVGQVRLLGKRRPNGLWVREAGDGYPPGPEACSRARFVSTRARWRL
jgi:hypothetical protein